MSALLLLDAGRLKVLVGQGKVGLHLLEGLGGDEVEAELLLALGEVEPELAPGRVSGALAEELGHLGAALPSREGGLVGVEDGLGGGHGGSG